MSKRLVVLCVSMAAMVGLALSAPVAGASTALSPAYRAHLSPTLPMPLNFSNKELVSQANSPLCAYIDGRAGNYVFGKDCTGTVQQTWSTAYRNICGGTHVVDGNGTTCPFKSGTGLNDLFRGDDIIDIINPNYSMYWAGFYISYITQNTGIYSYVQDGDCASACHLIDIIYSNDLAYQHYGAACSEGVDQVLQLEDTPASTTGRCKWNTANT